jgi:hypothetical protein
MKWPAVLVLVLSLLSSLPAGAVERLLVPQMAGWRAVVIHSDPGGEISELIPESETPETWTRRISVEAFRGAAATVSSFLDMVGRRSAEICDESGADAPRIGRLETAEAGSRTIACGRYKGDGRGTYTLYYAIRGRDAFYVVSRSWRGEPFPVGRVPVGQQELADWIAYMRAITLCDTADPARPCPK